MSWDGYAKNVLKQRFKKLTFSSIRKSCLTLYNLPFKIVSFDLIKLFAESYNISFCEAKNLFERIGKLKLSISDKIFNNKDTYRFIVNYLDKIQGGLDMNFENCNENVLKIIVQKGTYEAIRKVCLDVGDTGLKVIPKFLISYSMDFFKLSDEEVLRFFECVGKIVLFDLEKFENDFNQKDFFQENFKKNYYLVQFLT